MASRWDNGHAVPLDGNEALCTSGHAYFVFCSTRQRPTAAYWTCGRDDRWVTTATQPGAKRRSLSYHVVLAELHVPGAPSGKRSSRAPGAKRRTSCRRTPLHDPPARWDWRSSRLRDAAMAREQWRETARRYGEGKSHDPTAHEAKGLEDVTCACARVDIISHST